MSKEDWEVVAVLAVIAAGLLAQLVIGLGKLAFWWEWCKTWF